ncbi:hypothetical protein HOY80DRAFT_889290, partial [Tuber brumale]
TSASGIPASTQAQDLSTSAKERLPAVHPSNPPHIPPHLSRSGHPGRSTNEVAPRVNYWKRRGRFTPILVKKANSFGPI